MTDIHTIVFHLHQRRLALGWTQEQVASLIGTTQSAISDIETGETNPTLKTVDKYAKALGGEITCELPELPEEEMPEIPAEIMKAMDEFLDDPTLGVELTRPPRRTP